MRRPLCAFCLSALGVLALCSFLPQMGLLLPSAAIFVVFCLLVWWRGGDARGYAVCLLLGAVLGVGIMEMTGARLAKIQDAYAGKEVALTAEVESTGRAYTAGRVSAVLMVEKVDGEAVHFRVECASLPKCEAGGRHSGAAFRWMCRMPPSVWTTTPTALSSARNICPGCFVLGRARASAPGQRGSRRR